MTETGEPTRSSSPTRPAGGATPPPAQSRPAGGSAVQASPATAGKQARSATSGKPAPAATGGQQAAPPAGARPAPGQRSAPPAPARAPGPAVAPLPPRPTRLQPPPRPAGNGTRTARLTLKRVDPWSVFLYSLLASLFLGVALLVAVALLYAALAKLGVLSSVNTLIGDVTSDPAQQAAPSRLFSAGRVMTLAALIAAMNVVLLTALATLGAFLYNLCASLTGGIQVTWGDTDQ